MYMHNHPTWLHHLEPVSPEDLDVFECFSGCGRLTKECRRAPSCRMFVSV